MCIHFPGWLIPEGVWQCGLMLFAHGFEQLLYSPEHILLELIELAVGWLEHRLAFGYNLQVVIGYQVYCFVVISRAACALLSITGDCTWCYTVGWQVLSTVQLRCHCVFGIAC